jgi:hypothetical protein
MWNIYEQPLTLLIVSAVVLLATIIYRAVFPKRRHWWQWGFFVIVAAAAFGIDFFVQTDTEKVKGVIVKAVKAAQDEDVEAAGRLLAEDYHDSFNGSKQALMDRLRSYLPQPVIEKNVLRFILLDVNPPNATAVFTVRVVFDPKGPVYQYRQQMVFKFDAKLIKRGQEWFFRDVELVEMDLQPVDWKSIPAAGEIF